jgi:hypothetical protein
MPLNETRLGPGNLLLGTTPGTEYGFGVSKLALVPTVNSTDGTPTLGTPEPPPTTQTAYALSGTAINDFTDPLGLQRYCFDNDGDEVAFSWTPNSAETTPAILTGTLTVRAFEMGGDVAVEITTDFEWPITGKPVWTGGSAAAAGAGRKAKA